MPLATAIATALQNATRHAPLRTRAQPMCADAHPRAARKAIDSAASDPMSPACDANATITHGDTAPDEELAANAVATCNEREAVGW